MGFLLRRPSGSTVVKSAVDSISIAVNDLYTLRGVKKSAIDTLALALAESGRLNGVKKSAIDILSMNLGETANRQVRLLRRSVVDSVNVALNEISDRRFVTSGGTVAWEDTFATGIRPEWTPNTSGISNATHHTTEGGFVRILYNSNGDRGLNIRLANRNVTDLYIRVYARQNVHTVDGTKHLKIFGQGVMQGGEGSNITFQMLGYGSEYGITYGDRASGSNDNSVEMGFDGILGGGGVYSRPPPVFLVTSAPIYADLNWHRWDYRWKLNDPGQKNGVIEVRYDGVTVLHMVEVYNRADHHGPIDVVGIGQYLNFYSGTPFSRDYTRFAMSYDGWLA